MKQVDSPAKIAMNYMKKYLRRIVNHIGGIEVDKHSYCTTDGEV